MPTGIGPHRQEPEANCQVAYAAKNRRAEVFSTKPWRMYRLSAGRSGIAGSVRDHPCPTDHVVQDPLLLEAGVPGNRNVGPPPCVFQQQGHHAALLADAVGNHTANAKPQRHFRADRPLRTGRIPAASPRPCLAAARPRNVTFIIPLSSSEGISRKPLQHPREIYRVCC